MEANADDRETRGFISMITIRPSFGLIANCTFDPPVSTPILRRHAIAASRIIKAQNAARSALPYTRELTRAVSALASAHDLDHPLLVDVDQPKRSAVLLITSDRGLAGAYSANVIKAAEQLNAKLRSEGQDVVMYITGQKGVALSLIHISEPTRPY